ncbi:3-deoxy-7-phosphoheptulonate synthase, partial [Allisonella histaminiformans]
FELQEMFPLSSDLRRIKSDRDKEIQNILSGKDSRMLLIIGPCSADNEDSVLDYMHRLARVRDEVADKLFIIPRVYTNKPRTIGIGYKGMLHQPNPSKKENLIAGIIAVREMNTRIIKETGFTCADEILYPETYLYLADILSYAAIGARSVEDQLHRMIASGVSLPVGMKNPTSGDLSVLLNSIAAAQHEQRFIFRGWEVETTGNPFAHAILRGYVDKFGNSSPNYHYEHLQRLTA